MLTSFDHLISLDEHGCVGVLSLLLLDSIHVEAEIFLEISVLTSFSVLQANGV